MAELPTETAHEIQRRVAVLEEFVSDLRAYDDATGQRREELRSKINRTVNVAGEIVAEAGCRRTFTFQVSGMPARRLDPFAALFASMGGDLTMIRSTIDVCEEAIGVLQSPSYLEKLATSKNEPAVVETARGLQRVERLCRRFPLVARQLQHEQERSFRGQAGAG